MQWSQSSYCCILQHCSSHQRSPWRKGTFVPFLQGKPQAAQWGFSSMNWLFCASAKLRHMLSWNAQHGVQDQVDQSSASSAPVLLLPQNVCLQSPHHPPELLPSSWWHPTSTGLSTKWCWASIGAGCCRRALWHICDTQCQPSLELGLKAVALGSRSFPLLSIC